MGYLDQEKITRIKQILRWRPRGMTISDLSSEMKLNRNLVAKYLEILHISGQVEMQEIGPAKVYFLTQRVPIATMLEFSSDLVIVVDNDSKILQVNERVPALLTMKREALTGLRIQEIDNLFIKDLWNSIKKHNTPAKIGDITVFSSTVKGDLRHFRVKQVSTVFENGSEGFTFIIEDTTHQKKYQEMIEISEAKYRGLVRSSGEAIIGMTITGGLVSWNPAAELLFGYTEEEVLQKTVHILVPPDLQGVLEVFLTRLKQGQCIRRYDMNMIRKDGTTINTLMTICPIRGENDQIVGASSIVRDITSEKREQHLREYEDRYRTLVEDLNVGIYRSTAEPEGRFVWGNTALLDILGYNTMQDLGEVNVIDIFSKPNGRLELIEELQRNGFVKNRVLHLKRRDNSSITVSVTALAEFDQKKNLVFINGIVQDITTFQEPLPESGFR
ncbi:MAG TPA: PAS domain S-box protein [Methanoregula sp.]|nr:PAS domain S-box protein [Methanoregula sp.]